MTPERPPGGPPRDKGPIGETDRDAWVRSARDRDRTAASPSRPSVRAAEFHAVVSSKGPVDAKDAGRGPVAGRPDRGLPRRPRDLEEPASRGQANAHPKDLAEASRDSVDPAALYRLMAWLSPAYPIGAFSYSSGLEWAVEAGDVTDAETLRRWLVVVIAEGGGFCDAVFLQAAHRAVTQADDRALVEVAELAAAFAPSKERHLETVAQGGAFVTTTRAAWPCAALGKLTASWPGPYTLPVAVGVAAAGHQIAINAALHAYLHALASNLLLAGLRLIRLGQTDAQRLLAGLEGVIAGTVTRALSCALEDVGSAAFRADMASQHHETQHTRLFRS